MQGAGNDKLIQFLDDHPELQERIAGLVAEDKPTTATEMMRRDREKMLAAEYWLNAEKVCKNKLNMMRDMRIAHATTDWISTQPVS